MSVANYNYLFKLILVGDTCIINQSKYEIIF